MSPEALHPDSLAKLQERGASRSVLDQVSHWVASGDASAREPILEQLRSLPSGRVGQPPGPTFWYGSGALANQRLFDLRLATTYRGSLEDAFTQAQESLCPGEHAVIAARLAEAAGTGAYGRTLEPLEDVAGILHAVSRDRPELLGLALDNLINHRSFVVPAKLRLLGVVPWTMGRCARKDGAYAWVTRHHSTVMTLRGTLDGKKAWISFAVAKTPEEVDKLERKAVAAAEKKIGVALEAAAPEWPLVHLPISSELDWMAVTNAADRATLLRALREGILPREVPDVVVHSGHPWALFDVMSHGVPLRPSPATDERARALLQRLRHDLLPSALHWMGRRSWGDEHEAMRAHFGIG